MLQHPYYSPQHLPSYA